MRELGVSVVFAETTRPSALADAVAAELGGEVQVVELFTGSLGEAGSGAETLIEMLRLDATRIAEALAPDG
jgi:zinc/manganese transport system substrate-binding protein